MNKSILTGALIALAFPSLALAATPAPSADPHHSMPSKGGCCPEKHDGKTPDDCCKGMACCNSMKPDATSPASADAHTGQPLTH